MSDLIKGVNHPDPEPHGITFTYLSGRYIIVLRGEWNGWICYKHKHTGRWVSLRKATPDDWSKVTNLVNRYTGITA